jgi:hypothetical protein
MAHDVDWHAQCLELRVSVTVCCPPALRIESVRVRVTHSHPHPRTQATHDAYVSNSRELEEALEAEVARLSGECEALQARLAAAVGPTAPSTPGVSMWWWGGGGKGGGRRLQLVRGCGVRGRRWCWLRGGGGVRRLRRGAAQVQRALIVVPVRRALEMERLCSVGRMQVTFSLVLVGWVPRACVRCVGSVNAAPLPG